MLSNFRPNVVPFDIKWKKYDGARQDTDDNIIRRMRFACWTTKAIDAHRESVSHNNSYYANAL